MDDIIITTIADARARLNAAIVAHRALAWAAPAGILAGAAVAGLRALGVGAAGLLVWLLCVLACAAIGAWRAGLSRVDEAGAARWLDERLADQELLSAALACLGRDGSGRFDGEVLAKARSLAPRASSLRFSPRPLAKRAAIAAAACAVGAYLVLLAAPNATIAAELSEPSASGDARAGAAPASRAALAASAATPKNAAAASAFASSLFPDDKRRATLAERALREGRIDDLRDMLKAADLEYESRIGRGLSEFEKRKLVSERERIEEAASALAAGGLSGAAGDESGRSVVGGDEPQGAGADGTRGTFGDEGGASGGAPDLAQGQGPNGGSQDGKPHLPGMDGASQGLGQGSSADADADGASGSNAGGDAGARQGGKGYGRGSGEERDWGPISPSAGKDEAVIEPSKNSSFFELVLPGKDASSPIGALVPESRKSAESAMSREAVPLEYEDFVRSYFISLSKGDSR
jgi:hypothetical protein